MSIKERTQTIPIVDSDIVEAIRFKSSACYGALALCRGLGGGEETNAWWLCSHSTLAELAAEATTRQLDLSAVVNIDGRLVLEAMKYRHAIGAVTDAEHGSWWRRVKAGTEEP